jgi:hypothetical protein
MADITISGMTAATAFAGSAIVPIVDAGSNKKVSAATLFANIQDPVVMNSASENNDTIIKGQTDPALVFVKASTNRVGISTNAPGSLLDVDGDLSVNGPEYNKSFSTQTSSGAVDLTTRTTIVDASSPIVLQIGAGLVGQYKSIYRKSSGSLTLNAVGTTIIGGSTITFTSAGAAVNLQYINSAWYINSGFNVTLA